MSNKRLISKFIAIKTGKTCPSWYKNNLKQIVLATYFSGRIMKTGGQGKREKEGIITLWFAETTGL
jgi:hypothetical protein